VAQRERQARSTQGAVRAGNLPPALSSCQNVPLCSLMEKGFTAFWCWSCRSRLHLSYERIETKGQRGLAGAAIYTTYRTRKLPGRENLKGLWGRAAASARNPGRWP
jgi:hypothetical protein